jgi:phosphoribosylamine-glycine ligase
MKLPFEKIKRVLFICPFLSGLKLVQKVSIENPNVNIDYLGAEIVSPILPPNLRRLGDIPVFLNNNRMKLDLKKIEEIRNNYNFIYCTEFIFQHDLNFQEWRKASEVPILCPSKECSYLEHSKLTTKKMLEKLKIPFPEFEIIIENDQKCIEDLNDPHYRENQFMLKLDKTLLRTGAQTRVSSIDQYKKTIAFLRENNLQDGTFFAEKIIHGKEISAHFLCNGTDFVYLGSALDYKKLYENNQGSNSCGAGSYSPVDYCDADIENQLLSYADKIVKFLNEKGFPYHGILYLGIIIDSEKIANILEINTRPGNPEFGTIIDTIDSKNLLENLYNAALGEQLKEITHNKNVSVSINVLNQNYSFIPIMNKINLCVEPDNNFNIVKYDLNFNGDNYFFNISKVDSDLISAATDIYRYLEKQNLTGFRYRRDIGI